MTSRRMDAAAMDRVLAGCERLLEEGGTPDLAEAGFWRAVASAKRDPALVEEFGERLAAVDRATFERAALFSAPVGVGTPLMTAGTVVGLGLVAAVYYAAAPWNGLLLLAGTGALEATTHGLAHLVVGRLAGIRFTHWYVGSVFRPQPGVKVDYASYLRTPPRRRAWMHAAGATVTKTVPFLMLGPALVAGVPGWTVALLIALGIVQVATDVLWSVRSSDWKRFRREMRYARGGS